MKWFRHFEILLTFAAHILSAIMVFCIVGAGAWALHWVRLLLQAQGLDDIVLIGMHGIEILLFSFDVLATGFGLSCPPSRRSKKSTGYDHETQHQNTLERFLGCMQRDATRHGHAVCRILESGDAQPRA